MSKSPIRKLGHGRKTLLFALLLLLGISSVAYQPRDLFFFFLQSLEIFSEAFSFVVVEYADEVDPLELIGVGLSAMFNSLDPYTNYFDVSSNEQAEILSRSNFSGIGIQIEKKEDKAIVVGVIDGSPAQRSGIRTGDIIQSVNKVPISNLKRLDIELSRQGPYVFLVYRDGVNYFIVIE